MIIVDGRTDQEKLAELLKQPEQTHLEFKAELNFADKQAELNFVKDAVAMANRPPGGYVLIGVDDNGALTLRAGSISDRARFDGARLGDTIRKYIQGEIHVISQIHDLDGFEVVLIYMPHNRDGLPVPMSKTGQYEGQNHKPVVVFREGDVLVREGAKNIPLRYAHWNDLLSWRDQRLRQESRAEMDSLVAELAGALRAIGETGIAPIPLKVEMSVEAFAEALLLHLQASSDVPLRQFLWQTERLIDDADVRESALIKATLVAAHALYHERQELAEKAIDHLFGMYTRIGGKDAAIQLRIITAVYVLGSLAVRLGQWAVVRNLVLRPYPSSVDSYTYSSWIRHGQVQASRENLFPKNEGGLMISAARALMAEQPNLHPDIPDIVVPDGGNLPNDDVLFNSLCQFDILYCLIVSVEGQFQGGIYPAASAMRQIRANPAFDLVASDTEARAALFPDSSNHKIAEAMKQVFDYARHQSFSFGGYWSSLPPIAQQFVNQHLKEV